DARPAARHPGGRRALPFPRRGGARMDGQRPRSPAQARPPRRRRDHHRRPSDFRRVAGYTHSVKRLFGFAVGGLACAVAGPFAAVVLAGGVAAAALLTTGSTATTTTGATTAPPPALIPPGVTIPGIAVGGLTPEEATPL